jgi:hypothetical protein
MFVIEKLAFDQLVKKIHNFCGIWSSLPCPQKSSIMLTQMNPVHIVTLFFLISTLILLSLRRLLYVPSSSLAKQPFLSHTFLRRSFQICHPVFTSLDFATIILLQSKFVSLASTPHSGGLGLDIYVPH